MDMGKRKMGAHKIVDDRGRLLLGADYANKSYLVEEKENGEIVLIPAITIPVREKWLFDNKKALESVKRGLDDAKAGRTKARGSFAKYVDEDDEA